MTEVIESWMHENENKNKRPFDSLGCRHSLLINHRLFRLAAY
jgi:hypothetical protein